MILSDAGIMIEKWYVALEEKYPNIRCDKNIIMPNHIHMIVQIVQMNVGADRRVCPYDVCDTPLSGESDYHASEEGKHIGLPLHRMIQWFKTMTTNEYIMDVKQIGWKPFEQRLWQRNYYDHIIRNEMELNRIREYIRSNPTNWGTDRENPIIKEK